MRHFIGILFYLWASSAICGQAKPNIIVIFTDDLGYGDLSSFGHPTIRTPRIDGIGERGLKLTSFYVGANVCTPSRASLLTGRLPIRSGMVGERWGVLFPFSTNGLPASEVTLAEGLSEAGYATGMVGKWHLGHLPEFLPTRNGFDYYYGIPYSNDMRYDTSKAKVLGRIYPPLYMLENEEVVIEDVDQRQLTQDYTAHVLDFLDDHRSEPFFMYYAPNFPHVPLYASDEYLNTTRRGLYGDVVEELDWSVGQILDRLEANGLTENTLVIFTSDNGPWTTQGLHGGSAGLLRGGKATCWEGGMRVPALVQWPGTLPERQIVQSLGTTMDLYTTLLTLGGGRVPTDRTVDGHDLLPVWKGEVEQAADSLFYYNLDELYAIRRGPWKLHLKSVEPQRDVTVYSQPLLFNIEEDPGEQYEVSGEHPEIVRELRALGEAHRKGVKRVPYILDQVDNSVLSGLGF